MKKNRHLDPIIAQSVKASFRDGKLLEAEVTKLVSTFKKQSKVEAIYLVSGFLKGLKRELAKHTLVVESTIPLSKAEMSEIKKHFSDYQLSALSHKQNPGILGGIRAKIGDTVYDYSITAKLNQLKEAISR